MNITNTDLRLPVPGAARRVLGTQTHELARALFVAELTRGGLVHVTHDSFHGEGDASALQRLGQPVLVRSDADGDELEAFIRMPGGRLALIDVCTHRIEVDVAARTLADARAGASTVRERLSRESPVENSLSMAFWMCGNRGGDVRYRDIDAPAFDEIAGNYTAPVRRGLERLMAMRAPENGRLILWRGAPGTGKSHALRALARAWSPWCTAHFIMDPDELLGRGGAYMLDVLSRDGDDGDRWRLVILEDAGELIAADARAVAGQALSRLLNVADGLLGQGTRTLLLITTNEPLSRLHPAARRAGRCLADIEFVALSAEEANAWLTARGSERRVQAPTALADLFGGEQPDAVEPVAAGVRFGFARALDGPARV